MPEKRCQEFSKGWVKLRDIPPYLHTLEIARKLASLCGGLENQNEGISLGCSWDEDVWVKVAGKENGFTPKGAFHVRKREVLC